MSSMRVVKDEIAGNGESWLGRSLDQLGLSPEVTYALSHDSWIVRPAVGSVAWG